MIVAADLGGTQTRIAAGSLGRDWDHAYSAPRPEGFSVERFIALLRELFAEWKLFRAGIEAIGVSVAAVVDEEGVLQGSENLGWASVPLARLLGEAFGCPVAVDTDVRCGALFESREGGCARGLLGALHRRRHRRRPRLDPRRLRLARRPWRRQRLRAPRPRSGR